jgi:hypothetical protein
MSTRRRKRNRYLIFKGKKYRIHSSASDREIYKGLIHIITHLLPKKRKASGTSKKLPFTHPVMSATSLSRMKRDEAHNTLAHIKEERKLLEQTKNASSADLEVIKHKVADIDGWIIALENYLQAQYENQVKQQELLENTPAYQEEEEEGIPDDEGSVPKTPIAAKPSVKKKRRRPEVDVANIPVPPRRAKDRALKIIEDYLVTKQEGRGLADSEPGLYNGEVTRLMKKFKKRGFMGTFSVDELKNIEPGERSVISFVLNTAPHDIEYGHFVAVMIDRNKKTVEYFDPFAEPPLPPFTKNIRAVLNKMSIPSPVQLKVNLVRFQRTNSSNCGPFAMNFLIKRYRGETWKQASGYDKFISILKEEKKMRHFMQHIREFGTI